MKRIDFLKACAMTPVAFALGLRGQQVEAKTDSIKKEGKAHMSRLCERVCSLPFCGEIGEREWKDFDSRPFSPNSVYLCYIDINGNLMEHRVSWSSMDAIMDWCEEQYLDASRNGENEVEILQVPRFRFDSDIQHLVGEYTDVIFHI